MNKKQKRILIFVPSVLFLMNNTIISLLVICFYGWLLVMWLFKVMPKD